MQMAHYKLTIIIIIIITVIIIVVVIIIIIIITIINFLKHLHNLLVLHIDIVHLNLSRREAVIGSIDIRNWGIAQFLENVNNKFAWKLSIFN